MSECFDRIEHLRSLGAHAGWPDAVKDAAVRYYGRRCANRPPSVSKRVTSTRRTLEVGCFVRHALCTASDQVLIMLRRWIRRTANKAASESAPKVADSQARLREFAQAVRGLATDTKLTNKELKTQLCTMADATLQEAKVSRAALARAWLVDHPQQARAVLGKLLKSNPRASTPSSKRSRCCARCMPARPANCRRSPHRPRSPLARKPSPPTIARKR